MKIKIELWYDSNGNKLRKKVTDNGIVLYEQHYIGSFEYRDGTLEAVYHEEGRAVPNPLFPGEFHYEYTLKDHLGNSRVMFSDRNKDGLITSDEVLQENHYYPFGLNQDGPWQVVQQGNAENKYQYNGKELNEDFGLNWNDYGARWYDAAVGRWNAVDPSAEKYYSFSPYCYGINNPLRFIDPDGREIAIYYQGEKKNKKGEIKRYKWGKRKGQAKMETKKVVYNPGEKYEGDNDFVKDTFTALDYIQTNGADGGIVKALAETDEISIKIHRSKGIEKATEDKVGTSFFTPNQRLSFNNVHLTEFYDDAGENIIGVASPALGLLHELGHAYRLWTREDFGLNPNLSAGEKWQAIQREEQYVVDVIERPGAIILGDGIRYKYSNKVVIRGIAKSVTSNKPK